MFTKLAIIATIIIGILKGIDVITWDWYMVPLPIYILIIGKLAWGAIKIALAIILLLGAGYYYFTHYAG